MVVFVTAVASALVFSFLCSIFESVLLTVRHARVEQLVEDGRRAGSLLREFKSNMDAPIAAILIVNTVAHTVGASVAGATYENVFAPETLWIFTIVFTIAVLLFTEIVPKTLGVSFSDRLAVPVAYGIKIITVLLGPFVAVSSWISRSLRGNHDQKVTSIEEIRLLAALGQSEGSVGHRTANMIIGAARLKQLRARDVMVPRPEVTFLSGQMTRDEVIGILRRTRYSRFPFSPEGDPDQATGIVLAKELLLALEEEAGSSVPWDKLVREPLIVPPSRSVQSLLHALHGARSHMSLVMNEYGTFLGIVTHEDLLEEIVGEIYDETDRMPGSLWTETADGFQARATIDVRKVCAELGLSWSHEEDAVTLGGLMTDKLEHIPREGDTVSWRGYRLEVLRAGDRRAEVISITPEESPDEDAESE
jgi:CBS domain containing-hemolysin-like protein